MDEVRERAVEAALEALEKAYDSPGLGTRKTMMSIAITAYEAALWQPIETAPKDGRWFMAGTKTEYDTVGDHKWWCATARYETPDDHLPEVMMASGEYHWAVLVTHWRPLPDPPEMSE